MRKAGILCPLFSLSSKYGIGCLDRTAYDFVDFLASAGQHYWQLLPIVPTGFGDSPYESVSTFAGNPFFISVEDLKDEGLLQDDEIAQADCGADPASVNYAELYEKRFPLLRAAHQRFLAADNENTDAYKRFLKKQEAWLPDYALYMAIRKAQGDIPFQEWEKDLRARKTQALAEAKKELAEEISFYTFLQYCFYTQWEKLHDYAKEKGILLIGDMPFYTSGDSADVWAHPELFQLNADATPKQQAGCPPDAFTEDGQFWGNPCYDWKALQKTKYRWWFDRIEHALSVFDILRIDHFRAFDEYYAIPAGAKSAKEGKWCKGPGLPFFTMLEKECGELPLIAEDLGIITDDVRKLLKDTGFPGMAVLQFAFDDSMNSLYLPHRVKENTVVYTGTHDNMTTMEWVETRSDFERDFARRYTHSVFTDYGAFTWDFLRTALGTAAETCILPIGDFLCKGKEGRINTPGTIGENWKWRLLPGELSEDLAQAIRRETQLYGRL